MIRITKYYDIYFQISSIHEIKKKYIYYADFISGRGISSDAQDKICACDKLIKYRIYQYLIVPAIIRIFFKLTHAI